MRSSLHVIHHAFAGLNRKNGWAFADVCLIEVWPTIFRRSTSLKINPEASPENSEWIANHAGIPQAAQHRLSLVGEKVREDYVPRNCYVCASLSLTSPQEDLSQLFNICCRILSSLTSDSDSTMSCNVSPTTDFWRLNAHKKNKIDWRKARSTSRLWRYGTVLAWSGLFTLVQLHCSS